MLQASHTLTTDDIVDCVFSEAKANDPKASKGVSIPLPFITNARKGLYSLTVDVFNDESCAEQVASHLQLINFVGETRNTSFKEYMKVTDGKRAQGTDLDLGVHLSHLRI